MSVQYVILTTSLGPSVGDPTAMYTPPLRYKREEYVKPEKGRQTQHKLGFTPNNPVLNLLRAQAIQHSVDVGYYAPVARTTLILVCFLCSYASRSSTT